MADICYGVMKGEEPAAAAAAGCETGSARRRGMGVQRFRLAPGVAQPAKEDSKRKKREQNDSTSSTAAFSQNSGEGFSGTDDDDVSGGSSVLTLMTVIEAELNPRYGVASVCGRRREMEDAVAIHPLFSRKNPEYSRSRWHYFGVYDGHGCSHVATRCSERLHELVQEELPVDGKEEWNRTMERSFMRMDKEVVLWKETVLGANCRCELQTPDCDAVGSTAVVSVITPDRIIVANCGDSRAVLCRNGKPVPLSSDHKPDRADELERIQAAGGRVIYWDGPRVLGVLAMSRAIGDNYLKPYVTSEPEVSITERREEDDCVILASDGLWDVVSNETACAVASMCLRGKARSKRGNGERWEAKACTDASVLLTKLALARHSTDNVSVVVIDLRRGHVGRH